METKIWKKGFPFLVVLLFLFIPVSGMSAEENVEADWMSNEELVERLHAIEAASEGKVEVDVIGQTSQGNDIHAARVGTGDQVVIINGNIHGNEKSGPEAVVSMLETLADDSSFAQQIRDGVTIVAIPRLNMDGAALTQRQNVFPWEEVLATYPQLEGASPAWYYSQRNGGFDINRDFNANLNYKPAADDLPGTTLGFGFFLMKESQTLRDLYLELQAEFGHVEAFVDLHHMGTPVTNRTGEPVTIAIDYPPLGPDDSDKYDAYPKLDQDKSKRYSLAAALGVKEFSDQEENGVAQYIHFEERDYPGQARSSFALNGTATVLFEMPGQQPRFGYDQALIDRVENGLWGIVTRMADDTIDDLHGDDFFDLPRYWTDSVTDMKDVVERYSNEDQIRSARVARLLENHLTSVEHFEKAEQAEKIVKHLQSFQLMLTHYEEEGIVSHEAFNRLHGDANDLMDRWSVR